jgi:hypothetical protein
MAFTKHFGPLSEVFFMPIIRPTSAGAQPANPLHLSFVERLKAGRVVPVISDEATVDLALGAGNRERLVQGYADYIGYPMPDRDNLVKMTKFHKLRGGPRQEGLKDQELKADYLNYVKNHVYYLAQAAGAGADLLAEAEAEVDNLTVSAFANRLGYPRLDRGPDDPLLVLANLPIKVYLTTSPHTFLEDALRRASKTPRTELCRWRKELDSVDPAIDKGYLPSAREPLVYHLHGLDAYPDSLVLTEDDHLEFLVNVCQGQGNESADRVHGLVRKALFDDLILLGFSLSGWPFRVLYNGLIKPNGRQEDRGVCCLQLVPSEDEKRYLQDYLEREARFDVFWGDVPQYTRELHRMFKE